MRRVLWSLHLDGIRLPSWSLLIDPRGAFEAAFVPLPSFRFSCSRAPSSSRSLPSVARYMSSCAIFGAGKETFVSSYVAHHACCRKIFGTSSPGHHGRLARPQFLGPPFPSVSSHEHVAGAELKLRTLKGRETLPLRTRSENKRHRTTPSATTGCEARTL